MKKKHLINIFVNFAENNVYSQLITNMVTMKGFHTTEKIANINGRNNLRKKMVTEENFFLLTFITSFGNIL